MLGKCHDNKILKGGFFGHEGFPAERTQKVQVPIKLRKNYGHQSLTSRGVTERGVTAQKVLKGLQRFSERFSEIFRRKLLIRNGQESAEKC